MPEKGFLDCDFVPAYYLLFGKQNSISLFKTKRIFLTLAGVNLFPKKRRCAMRKKKQRPLFSPHQIQTMEREFAKQRYVTEEKRAQLALEVDLTEAQVKTWFQNRRTKWKKETKEIKESMDQVFLQTMRGNTVCENNCATFGFV